jgi:hypothetical protein
MARTWRHTTERAEVTAATLAKEAAQSAEMDAAGIVAGPADPKDVSDMLSTVKAAEAAAGVVRDKAAFDKRNGGGLPWFCLHLAGDCVYFGYGNGLNPLWNLLAQIHNATGLAVRLLPMGLGICKPR